MMFPITLLTKLKYCQREKQDGYLLTHVKLQALGLVLDPENVRALILPSDKTNRCQQMTSG